MNKVKSKSMDVNKIFDRMKKTLNLKSDLSLASTLNLRPSALSERRRRGTIPWKELFLVSEKEGINFHWLITGKGPMSLKKLEAQNLINVETGPLSEIIHFLKDFWDQANDKERIWLEVQFGHCFSEFRFSIKERHPKKEGTNDTELA